MKINGSRQWKPEDVRAVFAILATAALLLGLSIAGSYRNGSLAVRERQEAGIKGEKAEAREQKTGGMEENLPLTAEEKSQLEELSYLLSLGNLEGAARLLCGFELPASGFPCMYSNGSLKGEVSEEKGLVFTRSSTVFYGTFDARGLKGEGTALQVMELNEGRRYDYSYGIWENGKMNGYGECGYNYYDGANEEVIKESVKKGLFIQDLMEGEITYATVNKEGESTAWSFMVRKGVIELNERWTAKKDPENGTRYLLLSEDKEDQAYSVTEHAAKEVRWKNLIVYQ